MIAGDREPLETKAVSLFRIVLAFLLFTVGSCWGTEREIRVQASAAEPRIIGGSEALPGIWPWMGALVYAGGDLFESQMCGASLVGPNWVVTAAHCVDEGISPASIEVVFGVYDLKTDTGERYAVKSITVHPDFDPETLENDIALLELWENCGYPSLGIVESECDLTGTMGTAIGWGRMSSTQQVYPSKLQQVSLPIVSNQECNDFYSMSDQFDNPVTDTMMCAGYPEGGKDSCTKDSGGPLVVYCNETWLLAGIVSWGDGCGRPGFYGVYTRVSKYQDFIERTCSAPGWNEVYIPHITQGEPLWSDQLQVDNSGSESAVYTLRLYGGGKTVFAQSRSIPGFGKRVINIKQLSGDAELGKVSYSDPDLQFRLTFESIPDGGIAEMILREPAGSRLVLYFTEALTPAYWKGMVLANLSSTPASVKMSAMGDGISLGSAEVGIEPYSKIVGLSSDWFPGVPFEQIVRVHISSSSRFISGLTVTGNQGASAIVLLQGIPKD